MSKTALYRRYRPTRFDRLVGQEQVAQSLREQVRSNNPSHAYLFMGPRGCGKTSAARILARALNCTNLQDGEPCNTCESCVSILEKRSIDVREIDAASNNGVDAVRTLLSTVSLATPGKYRVIILDEAHMLTKEASNALLATLEEPPAHVVFILATTDPRQLLPTIRSRTQEKSFSLLKPAILLEHLQRVAKHANLDVSEEILQAAVKKANGSARDALSALDSLASTGAVPVAGSETVLSALANNDRLEILTATAKLLEDGTDGRTLAEELLGRIREIFFIQMGAEEALTSLISETERDVAKRLSPKQIVLLMDTLGDALLSMKGNWDHRTNLEVALMRWSRMA